MLVEVYTKDFPIVKLKLTGIPIIHPTSGILRIATSKSPRFCPKCFYVTAGIEPKYCPLCNVILQLSTSRRQGTKRVLDGCRTLITTAYNRRLLADLVAVKVVFHLPIVKHKTDCDHLIQTVFALLNKTIIADDSLVADCHISKWFSGKENQIAAEIEIKPTSCFSFGGCGIDMHYLATRRFNPDLCFITDDSLLKIRKYVKSIGKRIADYLETQAKISTAYAVERKELCHNFESHGYLNFRDVPKAIPLIRKGKPLNELHNFLRDSDPIMVKKPQRNKIRISNIEYRNNI